MPERPPNFLPFPFEALRRLTHREARLESAIARWLAIAPRRVAAMIGGGVHGRIVDVHAPDPHAAWCEVRVDALAIGVGGGGAFVRRLAQRVLGGPLELAAPRPLTQQEQAVWALAVATALDDLGVRGEVVLATATAPTHAIAMDAHDAHTIVLLAIPPELELRVPPTRRIPRVTLEGPVVMARCALPRSAVAGLATGAIIVVERCRPELAICGGAIGLAARGVETIACTEYVARAMTLPDDAHVELTVTVGTVRLTLRQLAELCVGAVVPLGRPLAGPFELRVADAVIGSGELVNIDGEVGVRVIRIDDEAIAP